MRSTLTLALASLLVTVPAASAAAATADPFSRLFQTPEQRARPQPRAVPKIQLPRTPAQSSAVRPTTMCGMTLVPVDPKFDAAIRRQAPLDPKPASRAMPAPACQQTK